MKLGQALNWLKSKLTPSSLIRSGRLLIERFTKQRSTMLNVGLLFRNSKWANYLKSNISDSQLNVVLVFANILVLIIFAFITSVLLYGHSVTLNALNSAWWQLRDLTYFFYFAAAAYVKIISIRVKNAIEFKVLFWFMPDDDFRAWAKRKGYIKRTREYGIPGWGSIKPTKFPTTPPKVDTADSLLVNELSSYKLSSAKFSAQCRAVKNLFKLSYNLRKLNDQANLNALKFALRRDLNFDDSMPITSANAALGSLKMWTNACKMEKVTCYNFSISTAGLSSDVWVLNNILSTSQTPTGLFSVVNINEGLKSRKLLANSNFSVLGSQLNDLNELVKSKRWLYKYNMLHSKSLSSSHNITNVKKLSSYGSYTSDMLRRNLWLANTLAKSKNVSGAFELSFRNIYGDYFTHVLNNTNVYKNYFFLTHTPRLEATKHYETSYLWFLKRLYSLNGSQSSSIMLLPLPIRFKCNTLLQTSGNLVDASHFTKTFSSMYLNNVLVDFSNTSNKDLAYHSSNSLLFNQSRLFQLYDMLATRTTADGKIPYFSLDSYSILLHSTIGENSSEIVYYDELKDESNLIELFKKQPSMSYSYIDLLDEAFAKDLYRYSHLNTRK